MVNNEMIKENDKIEVDVRHSFSRNTNFKPNTNVGGIVAMGRARKNSLVMQRKGAVVCIRKKV